MAKPYFDTSLPDLLKMKSTKADSARIMVLEDALRACDEYFKAGLVYSQHAAEWTEVEAAEQNELMQKLADVAGQKTIAALRIEAKPSMILKPGRTDWGRLDRQTPEETEAIAAADKDGPPMTDEEWAAAEVKRPKGAA